jgi:hypothetical protein
MTCPYRKEVQMVFCRAYPVKKPVPIDRVSPESTCDGASFERCPLFRDAVAESERSADGCSEPRGVRKGAAT